jgi:hypothetical protein
MSGTSAHAVVIVNTVALIIRAVMFAMRLSWLIERSTIAFHCSFLLIDEVAEIFV